jgi:hypothetical protein
MVNTCRKIARVSSLTCSTRSCTIVAAGIALLMFVAGCVPTQTTVSSSSQYLTPTSAGNQLARSESDSGIRVDAIQRVQGEETEPVTGVVTVRNTASASRTVNVGVTWLTLDGRAIDHEGPALKTVTLAPRESRTIVFRGEQGSRDFKVALSSVAQ